MEIKAGSPVPQELAGRLREIAIELDGILPPGLNVQVVWDELPVLVAPGVKPTRHRVFLYKPVMNLDIKFQISAMSHGQNGGDAAQDR